MLISEGWMTTICYVLCVMYHVLCTMYYAPCTMYNVLCSMYYVQFTIYYSLVAFSFLFFIGWLLAKWSVSQVARQFAGWLCLLRGQVAAWLGGCLAGLRCLVAG